MKKGNGMKTLLWVALVALCTPLAFAMGASLPSRQAGVNDTVDTDVIDTTGFENMFYEGAARNEADSALMDSLRKQQHDLDAMNVYIKGLARAYGDSVVVRWAIGSYPEWYYLARTGVSIFRHDVSNEYFDLDTLATGLKPLSLEKFKQRYPDTNDSIAYMAMGAVYGTGDLRPEQTKYEPGSVGAFTALAEDQKMKLLAALMSSEWRPDVADALGMRWVDRTAQKGKTYSYFILPTVTDTTGRNRIMPAQVENVKNERYKTQPYDITITDSIMGHGSVMLRWKDPVNSTFEIYRREVGKKAWEKVNSAPYAPPLFGSNEDIQYNHESRKIGTYEYAVRAHDAFGDLTEMSAPHRVHFPDMLAPEAPVITRIVIDRPNQDKPWEKIYANIFFRKDTMEADFVRYIPMYYSDRDTSKTWKLLTDQYIAPTDTMFRLDVTNVSSGMVTIAAVDTAENMGYSFPQRMRIRKMRPPKAPTNLKALTELDGTVVLMWDMEDTLDLHYYDVLFSNGLDHEFVRANKDHVLQRQFTDTISVDANERYIYYTVRGVNYDNNTGYNSDTLRVLRPNTGAPTRAYLDSAWTDTACVHLRWIGGADEIIKEHRVFRRKAGTKEWTLIKVFNGDAVTANGHVIALDDEPGGKINQRWEYAVETFSFWDIGSGLTPVYSGKLRYNNVVNVPVRLYGDYDKDKRKTKLAWETGKMPTDAPYFFCIYRKGADDKSFVYLTDSPSDSPYFTDGLSAPGETAEYYVSVRFRDGRATPPSNIVAVTAPESTDTENTTH